MDNLKKIREKKKVTQVRNLKDVMQYNENEISRRPNIVK